MIFLRRMKIQTRLLLLFFIWLTSLCFAQYKPTSKELEEYPGIYLPRMEYGLNEIEVIRKEDKLFYFVKGSMTMLELMPLKKAVFLYSDQNNWQIKFVKWHNKVSHFNLSIGGTEYRFVKNAPLVSEKVIDDLPLSCKTVSISVCINHIAKLYIKNNMLSWEMLEDVAPGKHEGCGIPTLVNGKEWKDTRTPYELDFSTEELSVKPVVLQSYHTAELIQAPDSSNNWETVMFFSDPTAYSHSYAVAFHFCPKGTIGKAVANKTIEVKEKHINATIDTTLFKRNTSVAELAAYKVFFERGKADLTPSAKQELKVMYDSLKTNTKTLEIMSYEKKGDDDYKEWKLYYERSLSVSVYLINIGLQQKRILFFGYGEDRSVIEKDLENRIKLAIKDQP